MDLDDEPLDDEPTDVPDATPPAAPPTPTRTMSLRTVIGAGIGAAAIAAAAVVGVHTLASGPSTAAAAAATNRGFAGPAGPGGAGMRNGGGMPGAFGTIASISGDSFTVSDPMRGATTTVHTTSATVVRTSSSGTGSVADLKVGDRVHVDGTTASDGSLTATEVDSGMGGPGMGQPPQGQMGQPPQGQPQP